MPTLHPVQMHIHIALVEKSLQNQLHAIANQPGTAWTYISCPPGGTPPAHLASNCR